MLRNQAFLLLLKNTKFPTPGDLLSEVGTGQLCDCLTRLALKLQ